MSDPEEDRPPLVEAYQWASRIMTISMEMVIPGFLGLFIDWLLGTKVVFMILGFAGGMVLGIWHLIKMTKNIDDGNETGEQGKSDQ